MRSPTCYVHASSELHSMYNVHGITFEKERLTPILYANVSGRFHLHGWVSCECEV